VAKLPGIMDLGGASVVSGRATGSVDVSGYARGAEALAGAGRAFGAAVAKVGGDLEDVAKKQEETQYLTATAGRDIELANLHTELAKSKDFANLDDTYQARSKEIIDKYAATVPDGRLRAHYEATSGVMQAHGASSISTQAFHGLTQADADHRKATLFDIQKDIGDNPDNPFRAAAIDGYNLKVDAAVRNGYMTPEQGALEKRHAAVALQTTEAQTDAVRQPLKFLRETGGLPRGTEALPGYWNKDVAKRAAGVDSDLMAVVKRASEISGTQFVIGDKGGVRDQGTQDQLVAAGRSQTRNSNHLTGRAIDLIPIVNGKPNPEASPDQYQEISRAMKQASTELGVNVGWGGDWKSFKDDAHFELPRDHAAGPNKFGLIDPNTMLRLQNHAQTILRQRSTDEMRIAAQNQTAAAQGYERSIIDGEAGVAALPQRKQIEDDPTLDEGHRNTLLKRLDAASRQDDAYNETLAKFMRPDGGFFNPFDTDERKQVDKIYRNLGGDQKALETVIDRTGIVPATAAAGMRGALVSNNAPAVIATAQTARNLMARNPQIFAGTTGQSDIESAAISYGQYTEHFGMTPEQAAQKIIEGNSPEYKAKVAARIKNEDVGEIIKKQLDPADLQKAFNEGWTRFGRPNIEFTEGAKAAAYSDYAELFKSKYMESGNVDTAKAQAIEQMKKIWGVSHLNGTGSGTLMRYPPERAPAYAGIPDVVGRIADEAIAAIKAEAGPSGPQLEKGAPEGVAITRDKIILTPTPRGETAQAYMAGEPVPYILSWFDKDGHLQMLNPGKAFVFDGQKAREKITEERRVGLENAVKSTGEMVTALG